MKILFFMRSTIYVRNFESTLRALAERGHDVHVVADLHVEESNALMARLCREHPGIHHMEPPAVPFSAWSLLGRELRRGRDYLRYLGPEYANAPKLRLRAERTAPEFVQEALGHRFVASATGRRWLSRVLHWCDRAVPRHPDLDAFMREQQPDLVLVTPLVEPGAPQAEYLRSARALGIRTGLCVYSWDNLTNKGLIHDPLDVVTVWNEAMKHEAITLHGVPASHVVVTGAAAYDHWFEWTPRETREAFCARIGLPANHPYLLYLCSSRFIAPNEVDFIRRWVTDIRAASPVLRHVGVLVRPHPQNTDQWKSADLGLDAVSVWPRAGANPMDRDSRAEYFDSIYHSAAVVGVNTSAQIESAIVGRGVYTVLAPEFRDTQAGTLHFEHLRAQGGGLLHVARDMSEHVTQLEAAVAGGGDEARCRRFVEAFVRPYGIDQPSTPRLVAALEAVGARGRARQDTGPWWSALLRPALRRMADRVASTEDARKEKSAQQEQLKQQRDAVRLNRRAEQQLQKQRAEEDREQRKREEQAKRDAVRRAREAFDARAYQNYLHVRDWAARWGGGRGAWWNATPEMVASLRSYTDAAGGAQPVAYQSRESELARRLKREIGFLRKQLGSDLFVPEPAELGGFGFLDQGALYNEDTATFFNALIALQDAAVLPDFRANAERRVVWEIGGGWGGFAYQFKRLCPNVTYVITAPVEQFLFSAVYLMSLFPDAQCRFPTDGSATAWDNNGQPADFVFVPEESVAAIEPPRLDLTLDVMALRAMEPSRACAHVRRAYEVGSRFFYTMQPYGDPDGSHVLKSLERYFWLHPVPPRRDPRLVSVAAETGEPLADPDFAHVVGWRRLRA